MIKNDIKAINLYSGWELIDGQRRTFEYTTDDLTTITLEKLVGSDWIPIFKQELTYDGSSNLLSVTGIKI